MRLELAAAVLVAAAGAWADWRTGHIPNKLTLGALGCAPLLHLGLAVQRTHGFSSQVWIAGGISVLGAIATGFVPYLMFMKNAIGGGDVKLLAAIGALLGPTLGMEAEMYSFLGACLIAPAFLAYEGKLLATMKNAFFLVANPFLSKSKRRLAAPELLTWFRMGPAIFLGTLCAAVFAR